MDEQFAIDVMTGRKRGLGPTLLRAGCEVESWGYAAAISARNVGYDRRWLQSHSVDAPVISVGNLTTGGTGKTPVTAYLAAELAARGFRPGIVSRGYRSLNDSQNDEQMVLAQLLPGVPQVRDRDRVRGAHKAIREQGCDLILLDDGFQHRRLRRDLDFVLIDATRPWGFDRLLPRGLLRESKRGLARADVVLITRCDQASASELGEIHRELTRWGATAARVDVRFAPQRLRNAAGEFRPLALLKSERPLAFCGIGNPTGFQRLLRGLGLDTEPTAFPDHHHYGPDDFRRLKELADAAQATCFVTTQKDLVKFPHPELAGRPVWAVEIAVEILAGGDCLEQAWSRLPLPRRAAA